MLGNSRRSQSCARLVLTLLTALVLAACTTKNPSEFAAFAEAGTGVADSIDPLLESSLQRSLRLDSIILLESREGLTQAELLDALEQSDADFDKRLEIFGDVSRHAQLLRRYFVTLAALADTSGDSAIGDTARTTAERLEKVGLDVKAVSLPIPLGSPIAVSSLIKPLTEFAVAQFRASALQAELQARGAAVANEIEILRAFFEALRESAEAEENALQMRVRTDEIYIPYATGQRLDEKAFTQKRLDALRAKPSVEAIKAAEGALDAMKLSFVAISGGEESGGSLLALIEAAGRLESLIAILKAPPA